MRVIFQYLFLIFLHLNVENIAVYGPLSILLYIFVSLDDISGVEFTTYTKRQFIWDRNICAIDIYVHRAVVESSVQTNPLVVSIQGSMVSIGQAINRDL